MKQSRLESIIEVLINYLIGFGVAYLTFKYLVPALFNINPSHTQSLGVTCLFTVISVIRSYIIRRFFNAGLHNLAHQAASKILVRSK